MSIRTEREGPVLRVTIDRPDRRNALDGDVLEGLVDAFRSAHGDDGLRVIVLTGAGDRAFCAGADLAGAFASDDGVVARHDQLGLLRRLFDEVERLPVPLVGRVNGAVKAGGMGVALACDLLVAADDVHFGTPEVKVGLWPFVISALLTEHLGPKRALDLMMTGRDLSAEDARAWGLVTRVVPRDRLDDAVDELVGELVSAAPLALSLGRRAFHESREMGPRAAMAYLHGMLDLAVGTDDVREGVTAFLERRSPTWEGR